MHPRDPKVAKELLEDHLGKCINILKATGLIEITIDGIRKL